MSDALVVLLLIALIVFVIVLIVLGIKLMTTLNKLDVLIDNLTKKAESLDSVFNIIDYTTNKFSSITDAITGSIVNFAKKKFVGRKERKEKNKNA